VEISGPKAVLLDELFGPGFALLAYGPNAQATLNIAAMHDFALGDLRKIAIVPGDYNADPNIVSSGVVGRDVSDGFRKFQPSIDDCLILVRPDRYAAAAAMGETGAIASMATKVRALVESSGIRQRQFRSDQLSSSAA
jgi:hypothetical protein